MPIDKPIQTGSQLRQMGEAELARFGEMSLRSHLVDQAIVAHKKYVPFDQDRFEAMLSDPDCIRYPVNLSFGIGEMAAHQFAHVVKKCECYQLHVHPGLENLFPDYILAASYFIPVINFGSLINDDHCLLYGASLSGMTVEMYCSELCRIADQLKLVVRDRSTNCERF